MPIDDVPQIPITHETAATMRPREGTEPQISEIGQPDTYDLRQRIFDAMAEEWQRRVIEKIEASYREHLEALVDIAVAVRDKELDRIREERYEAWLRNAKAEHRAEAAERYLTAVGVLHQPGVSELGKRCDEDGQMWPCRTVRARGGAGG